MCADAESEDRRCLYRRLCRNERDGRGGVEKKGGEPELPVHMRSVDHTQGYNQAEVIRWVLHVL